MKRHTAPHVRLGALAGALVLASIVTHPMPAVAQAPAPQEERDPSSCSRDFRVLQPSVTRSPQQMDLSAGYYQGVLRNTGRESLLVKAQFPYSILNTWVIYDSEGQIYSALIDKDITPDDGNVNPFIADTPTLAENRSYTLFFKPAGAPVPDGIAATNVLTLPTASENDRIYITMRSYWSQPGVPRIGGPLPTIQAVAARQPTRPVVCPGTGLGEGFFPLGAFTIPAPEPDRILFFRPPNAIIPMADGTQQADPNGCTGYAMARLDPALPNLIKIHKLPRFPDNQNYDEDSVWTDDYDVRYVGLEANGATILGPRSHVSMNDIKAQPDGSAYFLTIPRPSAEMTVTQRLNLIRKAQAEDWNILISAGQGDELAPFLTYRNKLVNSAFDSGISAVPCFGPDKGAWADATAEYASNPDNMGEYYIDGAICPVDDVLDDSCAARLEER